MTVTILFVDGSTLNNGKKNAVGGIGIYIPGYRCSCNVASTGHQQNDTMIDEVAMSYSLLSTSLIKVTNQISELIATIIGIEKLLTYRPAGCEETIYIYTDSKYVIDCATTWCKTWMGNGWKNAKNKLVDNLWLIYRLVQLTKKYPIIYKHVKAHTVEPDQTNENYLIWKGNDYVDKLAQSASHNALTENGKVLSWKSLASLLVNGVTNDMKCGIPYCDEINDYYNKIISDSSKSIETLIPINSKAQLSSKHSKKANLDS